MLRGMRWLLISRIFASCRPSRHIDLPLFSRYFTCIDMEIFLVALAFSAACARFYSFIVARFRGTMFVRRVILATEVPFVVMVCVMDALSVIVVAIAAARLAIFGIIAALLVDVLGLVAMDMARCANELRRSLPLGLVAFVFTITRRFVAAIAIAIVVISDNCECTRYSVRRPYSSSCPCTCF